MKETAKPSSVFLAYFILVLILYSLGFILSDGWFRIDSSPFRDLLYILFFVINPAILVIGLIHFFATIISKDIAMRSIVFGFVFGFSGPLLLHIMIVTSEDSVAVMGYIAVPIFYFIAYIVGFLLSCISLKIWSVLNKRKITEPPHALDSQG